MDAASLDQTTFDLSVKNPNGGEEVTHRSPQKIMDEIAALDAESAKVLANIGRCYEERGGKAKKLGEVCEELIVEPVADAKEDVITTLQCDNGMHRRFYQAKQDLWREIHQSRYDAATTQSRRHCFCEVRTSSVDALLLSGQMNFATDEICIDED